MLRATSTRVQEVTDQAVNQKIHRHTEQRLMYYATHRDEVDRRLWELDNEWDTERVLETAASGLTLLGLVLGTIRRRRWFLLPLVVTSFLLMHALQGWCPPIPIIRRLGIRTAGEIDQERYALKALRGDFALGDAGGRSDCERISDILAAASKR